MTEKTYRIGEAADILNLKTYVLRFWETEFPQLTPLRTEKGQRLYSERDLALLRRIRELLHEQGMTIDGARRVLTAESHGGRRRGANAATVPAAGMPPGAASSTPADGALRDTLRIVHAELLQLRALLLRHSALSPHRKDEKL